MRPARIFNSTFFMQPSDNEPIRSVVSESAHAVIVAWYVKPGQTILPHTHPQGQDTWTILSGEGRYFLDATTSANQIIKAGDIVVARANDVHGVVNTGSEPLMFVSVVSPADAGYYLLPIDTALK